MEEIVSDIPRIYTAIAEWLACMIYVFVLKKRYRGIKSLAFIILSLAIVVLVQYIAGTLPLYLWIPGMMLAMLSMYLCIFWLCKIRAVDAMFWTARAFVLAEFAASVEWQLHHYLDVTLNISKYIVWKIMLLILIYAMVFIVAYFLERRYKKSSIQLAINSKDLISAVGIALVIFLISNISFINKNTPLSGKYAGEIFYIRTLVDLCGIILFFAQQEQRIWLHAKLELNAMQNILHRQYEQYCLSKENIENLNRRYHDLKHQIGIIKLEKNPDKKAKYLDEMETGIRMYEAQYKTGNEVLDTIITSKSMCCVENNINFTCVAEGKLLDFMDVMDICSIAGNSLDNAIESVSKLQDTEKRLIKMAIFSQNDLIMIRFENYIENKLSFEHGLPITTKNKKENHGYGIKSIKNAAEKYGGSLKISTTDNWFSLCLLIPMEKDKKSRTD